MTAATELPYDPLLIDIADYVDGYTVSRPGAHDLARYVLMDSLACAYMALDDPACANLLGPPLGSAPPALGARVPGTGFLLDPSTAAFNISCLVRWSDYSDAWVTTTTSHPSDDLGAILAAADAVSRQRMAAGGDTLLMRDVLDAIVKAHEIQGVLGTGNAFNRHGIDHSFLVRIACAAVVAKLLGATRDQIAAAASLAFFDATLCVHRFGSNTGPRKGWASAEAAAAGLRLGLMASRGEPGYPQVLSHEKWGFEKHCFGGEKLVRAAPFGSRVVENVLFKIQAPVVIHAQTAIECAFRLHARLAGRVDDIRAVRFACHRRTLQTIDKRGPLRNAADRDHCLQYAAAIVLLHGRLTAEDYQDDVAADPRIDRLRACMEVREESRYSALYDDPELGANPAAMEIVFADGSSSGVEELLYPLGHPRRRDEGLPLLVRKFESSAARRYPAPRAAAIRALLLDLERLSVMPVPAFTNLLAA